MLHGGAVVVAEGVAQVWVDGEVIGRAEGDRTLAALVDAGLHPVADGDRVVVAEGGLEVGVTGQVVAHVEGGSPHAALVAAGVDPVAGRGALVASEGGGEIGVEGQVEGRVERARVAEGTIEGANAIEVIRLQVDLPVVIGIHHRARIWGVAQTQRVPQLVQRGAAQVVLGAVHRPAIGVVEVHVAGQRGAGVGGGACRVEGVREHVGVEGVAVTVVAVLPRHEEVHVPAADLGEGDGRGGLPAQERADDGRARAARVQVRRGVEEGEGEVGLRPAAHGGERFGAGARRAGGEAIQVRRAAPRAVHQRARRRVQLPGDGQALRLLEALEAGLQGVVENIGPGGLARHGGAEARVLAGQLRVGEVAMGLEVAEGLLHLRPARALARDGDDVGRGRHRAAQGSQQDDGSKKRGDGTQRVHLSHGPSRHREGAPVVAGASDRPKAVKSVKSVTHESRQSAGAGGFLEVIPPVGGASRVRAQQGVGAAVVAAGQLLARGGADLVRVRAARRQVAAPAGVERAAARHALVVGR
ncbi:hypothetical protein STIAU_5829 [Stigmatella aurantiaca DW4/3-1]|uniref:Uncharacterized protein n=1 Tax=Stigmatella aurantiaca (strain DW4/3-1) TaxID=378806 RepID=Q098Y0_STIAD|nr:hypothetical protein STIAU_5829 [Stigmatella aurantiaca DW4/3-1]